MGTILASAIIAKARIILQDTSAIRWADAELLGWLNDAQRVLCAALPELTSTTANLTLVVGTKQTLPAAGVTLLKIVRNMGVGGSTPGTAMRKVPQELLDSQVPDWHTQTPVTALKHYVYDPRSTRTFYVYPPSVVNNQVEALYTVSPTDLATTSTAIGVDDIYQPMLLEYTLYRAYSKDLELAGNDQRAEDAMKNFTGLLSAKKGVDTANLPSDQVKG